MFIYTDPHLGLTLGSSTTPQSRQRLRQFISEHTMEVVDSCVDRNEVVVCGGDFFDKYQNPEEVLFDSLPIANLTDKILAGNHDVVNIAGRRGSLDVVSAVHPNKIVECHFGNANYGREFIDGRYFYLVPHHSSQELFESALQRAAGEAATTRSNVLVAHCNYDSPFVTDKITLNLPKRIASYLLEVFDFIVLGHEHNHRTDLNDRVIVVGSPHPVGFGDMSDKFILEIPEGEGPKLHGVWSSRSYLEVPYDQLLAKANDRHGFIRVTGKVMPSQLHDLAASVKTVWSKLNPFAVKLDVEIVSGDKETSRYTGMSPDRLHQIISAELQGNPDLYNLWKEITRDQLADAQ